MCARPHRTCSAAIICARRARSARASWSALIRHGIRNGSVPVDLDTRHRAGDGPSGRGRGGACYALPGLGSMLLLGIEQRDYPNVQGVLFVSTLLVLLVGFAADLVQRLIDPRLRDKTSGLSS